MKEVIFEIRPRILVVRRVCVHVRMCQVGEDLGGVDINEGNHTVYVGHGSECAIV